MAIIPQTKVELYENIPLDSGYKNTILFTSLSQQRSYFNGKRTHDFSAFSYQRTERQYIRVSGKADLYYNCNYMAFQNSGYGEKWFYCFVLSVEYINDNTTQIEFAIDVMQTYLFDVELKPSFVEREHSRTDEIGDNIQQDPMTLAGDYICMNEQSVDLGEQSVYLVGTIPNIENIFDPSVKSYADFTNGVASAYLKADFPLSVFAGNPIQFLQTLRIYLYGDYAEQGGQIITLFQAPVFFNNEGQTARTKQVNINVNDTVIGNYTPRNKKMFTYPYNFLRISNNVGGSKDYKWEFFSQLARQVQFNITGIAYPSPACVMYPAIYNQIGNDVESGVALTDFPQCIYTVDGYQQYLTATKYSRTYALGSSVLSGALQLSTGNVGGVGTILSGVSNEISNNINNLSDRDSLIGNIGDNQLNISMGRNTFSYYSFCIRPEIAMANDYIWDMYGYPCNQIKTIVLIGIM